MAKIEEWAMDEDNNGTAGLLMMFYLFYNIE